MFTIFNKSKPVGCFYSETVKNTSNDKIISLIKSITQETLNNKNKVFKPGSLFAHKKYYGELSTDILSCNKKIIDLAILLAEQFDQGKSKPKIEHYTSYLAYNNECVNKVFMDTRESDIYDNLPEDIRENVRVLIETDSETKNMFEQYKAHHNIE